MNGTRVNVRREEINREFRLDRFHLRKHPETRHWPIWQIFFGHRRHVFARICANRRKSREARGNIARRVSVCQLSASDRYSDKDESKSSARFGFSFGRVCDFSRNSVALRRAISRNFENTTAWFDSRIFPLSAGTSLERVKKVIVCFARRVLRRVFPDPEMSAFLTVIIPQREFSHLMRIRRVRYTSELQVTSHGCAHRRITLYRK